MKILDGVIVAKTMTKKIKKKIKDEKLNIFMSIVQLGNNESSNKYIKLKLQKANELGINVNHIKLNKKISEEELIKKIIKEANNVDGLIVQLPLPNHINASNVLNSVPTNKDIDGLSERNESILPATPRGIMDLIKYYNIDLKSKLVGIIGQSNLVGKPIADLCEKKGALVSRYTKETGINGTEKVDVLIVAAGEKDLVKKENIKDGVYIIDVGINVLSNKKVIGDVDRMSVGNKPAGMSPVPGGVGPMTVISLFNNLIEKF